MTTATIILLISIGVGLIVYGLLDIHLWWPKRQHRAPTEWGERLYIPASVDTLGWLLGTTTDPNRTEARARWPWDAEEVDRIWPER